MAKRVVVTGSSGMLGSNLVRDLLAHGHQVIGVDRCAGDHRGDWPRYIGDVRDAALMTAAVRGADAIVHCASALPSYPAAQIHDVIVNGARSVLSAAARAGVGHVVHISSTAVYGLPKIVPTTEGYPRDPVDPYSAAKAEAEREVERARTEGRCVTILRPKTFLGPGRMGLFAMLFEWADEARNFPVLGDGSVRIQMLAIEDLVTAIGQVLDLPTDIANDTYNLAAADFGTLREDFQAVLDAAGHGKRVVSLPARPALSVLRILELAHLSPVYGRLLHKLMADSYVSIDKARQRIGFAPSLSNRDAILRAYAWWRTSRTGGPVRGRGGVTSRDAWRQGALTAAKVLF
jgi:nucleoside-diphosphate-sugar epimerase